MSLSTTDLRCDKLHNASAWVDRLRVAAASGNSVCAVISALGLQIRMLTDDADVTAVSPADRQVASTTALASTGGDRATRNVGVLGRFADAALLVTPRLFP